MDDESGTNRSTAGDYDAETNGDTVVVTIYGNDRANDIYTLNFSTETTGSGMYEDFVYLQSDQVDRTFEATNQTNIYKDLEGSGDFRFDVLGSLQEDQTTDPRGESGSGTTLAPRDLEGLKIKFSYDGGSSILEFSDTYDYEMDDESGANREFAGDYDFTGYRWRYFGSNIFWSKLSFPTEMSPLSMISTLLISAPQLPEVGSL